MGRIVLIVFLVCLQLMRGIGQVGESCGTSVEDLKLIREQLVKNKTFLASHVLETRGSVYYVPVTFHLVAAADGSGRALESDILDMLCQVNATYNTNFQKVGQVIQFYIKSIQYINNNDLYNSAKGSKASTVMLNNKATDALNLYVVNSMGVGSEGVLAYYTAGDGNYGYDWVVITIPQATGATAATAAHEFGHFFSLLHTFSGWEQGGYSPGTCAAATTPLGNTTELVSRDATAGNCNIAGDMLCDTPPDYNFGFGNTGCTYTQNALDPKCVKVSPDILNLMGYFIGCESTFSTQQKQAMLADYTSNSYRNYIKQGSPPDLTEITAVPNLTQPVNAAVNAYSDLVTFNWSAVKGASYYLLEYSKYQSFIVAQHLFVTNKNTMTVSNRTQPGSFLASSKYYWRVRPFSPYKSCTSWSAVNNFTTGTLSGLEEVAGLSSFEVYPNPVGKSHEIHCLVQSSEAIKGTIQLFSMTGQVVHEQAVEFSAGVSSSFINTEALSVGIYILTLKSGVGIVSRKIIISD